MALFAGPWDGPELCGNRPDSRPRDAYVLGHAPSRAPPGQVSRMAQDLDQHVVAFRPCPLDAGQSQGRGVSVIATSRATGDTPPDGYRAYSANRHARDEIDGVRMTATSGAHFKIGQSGPIGPRLTTTTPRTSTERFTSDTPVGILPARQTD